MNFRKLNIFYETASSLNMTEVARKLYISQPSVSQAIKELEKELDIILFDRIGKKIHLTYEGEIYLKYVKRILNLYDEATVILENTKKNTGGRIRVGASTTVGAYVLPNVIKSFLAKNKDVDISIVIENTSVIEKLVLDNKVDIAFVEGNVYAKELITEKIWEDKLVFIKSIANKNSLYKDGEKLSIIMREEGSGTRELVESNLKINHIDYNISMELGNTQAIINVVEVGLGIACVPYRCVEEKIKENIFIEFKVSNMGEIKRNLKFICHQDKFLSNRMKAFLNEAKLYK